MDEIKKEIQRPNKKGIYLFYKTIIDILEDNSDEEVGNLIRAAAMYELYGELPNYTDRYMISQFKRLKCDIDLSMNKWDSKSQQNAENGKKGGKGKALADEINRAVKNSTSEGELAVRLADIKATEEQKKMAFDAFRDLNAD